MSGWRPGQAVAVVGRQALGELEHLTRGTVDRVTKTFVEVVDEAGARTRWTLHGWPWGAPAKPRCPRLRVWRSPEDDEHVSRAAAIESLERDVFALRQALRDGALARVRGAALGRLERAAELVGAALEALS